MRNSLFRHRTLSQGLSSVRLSSGAYLIAKCLFVLVLVSTSVSAQNVQHTENRADQALRSNFRVDPATLGMSFSIPLGSYPGRGGSVPVTLNYNSKLWRIAYEATHYNPGGEIRTWTKAKYAETSTSGWTSSLGIPWIEYTGRYQLYNTDGTGNCDLCEPADPYGPYYFKRIHVHLSDGSAHLLETEDAAAPFEFPNGDFSGTFKAVDGSRMYFDASTNTLHLADGSSFLFTATEVGIHGKMGRHATAYIDRNGNTLTYNLNNRSWTDTLGRTLPDPIPNQAPTVGEQIYDLPGIYGNTSLRYKLRWANLGNVLRVGDANNLTYTGDKKCSQLVLSLGGALFLSQPFVTYLCADGNPSVFNPVVLSELELPNGQKYQFKYNIYGEIEQVLLPTGGYERYEYNEVLALSFPEVPYAQSNRGVTQRWVSEDGTTEGQPWQYTVETGSPYTVRSTAPDSSYTRRVIIPGSTQTTQYLWGNEPATAGLTKEERAYSSTDQMLRRTLTDWFLPGLPAKEVSIILDTGGNALSTTTKYQYDADLNLISTSRYDFVSVDQTTAQTGTIDTVSPPAAPGTLLRTDETTFLVNDTTLDSGYRDTYRARNLLGLPSSSRVKNAAGTVVAQREIKYDETAYPLLTYGTVTGWGDPGTSVRGLPTTSRAWLSSNNSWLESHAQYDQLGNPRKVWDALGNLSETEFASANHYAYQTRSVSPDPDGADSMTPLVTTATYDFTSGLPLTTVDANDQTTTFEYAATDALSNNNPLQRLTKVARPDAGWTAYGYNDTPGGVSVLTRTALDASRSMEATQYFDGLGRAWRSKQSEGATSIYADVEYDSMGRAWRTSNPYRDGEAIEWTETTFDALSRMISVTTPDGSQVSTAYGGSTSGSLGATVTVTDQAGKLRRSVTNGLGQLIRVDEPTTAGLGDVTNPNQATSYTYDTLSNLTQVSQGAQTRTFVYNSLSRLTSAANPFTS